MKLGKFMRSLGKLYGDDLSIKKEGQEKRAWIY